MARALTEPVTVPVRLKVEPLEYLVVHWEHYAAQYDKDGPDNWPKFLSGLLNNYGAEGWRLAMTDGDCYIFERVRQ